MPINAGPNPPALFRPPGPQDGPRSSLESPRCDPRPSGQVRHETPQPLRELRLPHGGALRIAGRGGPRRQGGRTPPCRAGVLTGCEPVRPAPLSVTPRAARARSASVTKPPIPSYTLPADNEFGGPRRSDPVRMPVRLAGRHQRGHIADEEEAARCGAENDRRINAVFGPGDHHYYLQLLTIEQAVVEAVIHLRRRCRKRSRPTISHC